MRVFVCVTFCLFVPMVTDLCRAKACTGTRRSRCVIRNHLPPPQTHTHTQARAHTTHTRARTHADKHIARASAHARTHARWHARTHTHTPIRQSNHFYLLRICVDFNFEFVFDIFIIFRAFVADKVVILYPLLFAVI